MDWIQFLAGLATIIGGNYAIMKFLTKDIRKDVERHEKNFERMQEESRLMNMRLDGLFKVLLDRIYGNPRGPKLKEKGD
jgi:hypothetical protein